jgi:hypothetical protein
MKFIWLIATFLSLGTTNAAAQSAYFWYDGGERRTLYIDTTQTADFSGPRDGKSVLKPSGLVEKGINTQSPVFKDQASGTRTRALPGGVIVVLSNVADEATARAQLLSDGLKPVRALGSQANTWLVESPPGLAALELANRLHESRRYVSVSPNWWQERSRK